MGPVSFTVDKREFDRTLQEYRKYSKRDPAVICNTKAFYIARRAIIETPKADKAKVREELKGGRIKNVVLKRGRVRPTKYNLAQLIIIARRAAQGKPTSKSAIADDVRELIAARIRSVAFIKSGWIPAIKKLEPLAAKIGSAPRPKKSESGIQYGSAKGNAKPAVERQTASCEITNDALPRKRGSFFTRIISRFHDPNRTGVYSIAAAALQRAVDAEERSMKEHIEDKLRDSARRAGVKTN